MSEVGGLSTPESFEPRPFSTKKRRYNLVTRHNLVKRFGASTKLHDDDDDVHSPVKCRMLIAKSTKQLPILFDYFGLIIYYCCDQRFKKLLLKSFQVKYTAIVVKFLFMSPTTRPLAVQKFSSA